MASIFDIPPPPVFTRDGRDGFPPEADFEIVMAEYVGGLNPRKRDKALMTQAMYDSILVILTNPHDTRCATAQFRFWTKKMFRLVTTAHAQIVTHENRPVAVKEQIYDVLVQCHSQCSHGGRDKTSNQVRRYYSWIPKELIARFVKSCPLCNARRTAKSGGGTAGIAALTALGADANALLAANGGLGDSSPPSESSTSTNSAVTTPSRQTRPHASGGNHTMPFTPGSYLASAMYQYQAPLSSASSLSSNFPAMPSPSHNPQDWTHWVNTTPQRIALAESTGSNASNAEALLNSNPTLHFSYHTGMPESDKHNNVQTISLQTPPQTVKRDSHQDGSVTNVSDGSTLQQYSSDSIQSNSSQSHTSTISAGTQAYYSQLMQQTMASFLQAPQMSHQWSSDSVTTVSSASSASSYSSSEFEDLDEVTRNSPLPPLPPSSTEKEGEISALQQQIDNLTSHLEGVNSGPVIEEDEEASFQSFMSSFKQPPVEQDQIDPLLRAMNLDVMQGIPLVGDAPSPMHAPSPLTSHEMNQEMDKPKSPAPPGNVGRPAKLGGNGFKFPPAVGKSDAKKNDKKSLRSNSRTMTKCKSSFRDSRGSAGDSAKTPAASPAPELERQNSLGHSTATTPDLTSYFRLQDTVNQIRDGLLTGTTPTPNFDTSYSSQTGQAQSYNEWQGDGEEMLSQSLSAPLHGEFSFNVSDMSGDVTALNAGNGFNCSAPSTAISAPEHNKMRHRPPQLDFSSFSNNNAFLQGEAYHFDQDAPPSLQYDKSFLSIYQYAPTDFNQAISGCVSAPANITQFMHPENSIVTPNVPLFNYEQQIDPNFDFTGNSFADYAGMDVSMPMASANSDYGFAYAGNGMPQGLHAQGYELQRPASAGGFLEHNPQAACGKTMSQQQQIAMMPAIHSAPYFHLPISSQQQQAQARGLSEQIQAILDSAVPTNEAMVEHATARANRMGRK